MKSIKINDKIIGDENHIFIIIEIGSNYNQDFETAKKMIDMVKESGLMLLNFKFLKKKDYIPRVLAVLII